MKRGVWVLILCMPLFIGLRTRAQQFEIQQLLLDVEKLTQLKNILADLKNGYTILSQGYQTVKNISEGNYNLHQAFLNGLLQVSPVVRKYKKVADIINLQVRIVSSYKQAFKQFKGSGQFSVEEIGYLENVYSNLFIQSLKSLDDLATVLMAGKLRMSDDERLTTIDGIWNEVENEWIFLRHFNDQAKILAVQRFKETAEIGSLKRQYGISR